MAFHLNPELVVARKNAVIEALKQGHSYTTSLKIAGLNSRSASQWRETDLAFEEAVQKHLQPRPQAVHNQKRMPVRTSKDVLPEQKGDVVAELCAQLEEGLPIDFACLCCDISRATIRDWMENNAEIRSRINRAQGKNLRYWIACIREGAANDWKAALAYLERLYPQMFAEVKAIELTQRMDEKKESTIIDVTPQDVLKKLQCMTDQELMTIMAAAK